jgi:hypothetical protein
MNTVVQEFRQTYPTFYQDATDDQLTVALGHKFPAYLENDEFRNDFNRLTGQNRQRPSAAVNTNGVAYQAEEEEDQRLGLIKSTGYGTMIGMGQTGADFVSGVAEAGVAAVKQLRKALGIKGIDSDGPVGYGMMLLPFGYLFTSENTLNKLENMFGGSREAGEEFARDWTNAFNERGGSEFFRDLGAGAYSLMPTFAALGLGWPGVMGAAGLQSLGGTFSDARKQYIENGYSEDQATRSALVDSVMAGVKTALITRMFGKWGPEGMLHLSNPAFREALKKSVSSNVVRALPESARRFLFGTTSVALGSASEGVEEGVDQALDGVLEKYRRNPNKPWAEIWDEGIHAAKIGAALGFGAQSIVSIEQGRARRKLSNVLQPFITDPNDPRVTGRATPPPLPAQGAAAAIEAGTQQPPATQSPPEGISEPSRAEQMEARIAELVEKTQDPTLQSWERLDAQFEMENLQAELVRVQAEMQAEAEIGPFQGTIEQRKAKKNQRQEKDESDPYNPDPQEVVEEEAPSEDDVARMEWRRAVVQRAIEIQENNEMGRLDRYSRPVYRDPYAVPEFEKPDVPAPFAEQSHQTWLEGMGPINQQLNAADVNESMPDGDHRAAVKTAFNVWSELTGRGDRPWRNYLKDEIKFLKEFYFSPAHGNARYEGHVSNLEGSKGLVDSVTKVPYHSSEQAWARELMLAAAKGDHGTAITALLRLEDFVNNSENMLQDYAMTALPEGARLAQIQETPQEPGSATAQQSPEEQAALAAEHFPHIELAKDGAKRLDRAPRVGRIPEPLKLPEGAKEAQVTTPPLTFEDENKREAQLNKLDKEGLEMVALNEPTPLELTEAQNFSKEDLVQHIITTERKINNEINRLDYELAMVRKRHGDPSREATELKFKIMQLGGNMTPTGEKGTALAYKNVRTGQIIQGPEGEADIAQLLTDQFPDVYESPNEWEPGYMTDTGRFVDEKQALVDGVEIMNLIRC